MKFPLPINRVCDRLDVGKIEPSHHDVTTCNLLVRANQEDAIVVVDKTGKVIGKNSARSR
jgi:hypothetical protein